MQCPEGIGKGWADHVLFLWKSNLFESFAVYLLSSSVDVDSSLCACITM